MYSYVQIKAKLEHSLRSVYFSNFFQFLQVKSDSDLQTVVFERFLIFAEFLKSKD